MSLPSENDTHSLEEKPESNPGLPDLSLPYHKYADKEFPLDAVIARLAAGEYQKDIAASLGITPQTLSRRLIDNAEAKIAREIAYTNKLDSALQSIEEIAKRERLDREDADLARVREAYCKRLEYRAAVELPHRFGPRPQTQIAIGGEQMTVNVVSYAAPLQPDNTVNNLEDKS